MFEYSVVLHYSSGHLVSVRVFVDLAIPCIVLWQLEIVHKLLAPSMSLNAIL